MRRLQVILVPLVVLVAVILALVLYARRSHDIPSEDRLIAWIHGATNSVNWERFVGGLRHLESTPMGQRLGLTVDDSNAFLDQTSVLPEVVLSVASSTGRLRIRWYKLTSQTNIDYWVRELSRRDTPPLAIIGGGSSDRARDLAVALEAARHRSAEADPLLMITTATADHVYIEQNGLRERDLLDIYAGRSFRFCFTNSQMADALSDFVLSRPGLRPHGPRSWLAGAPAVAACGLSWGTLAMVVGGVEAPVYTLEWEDDPYSIDLAEHLRKELRTKQLCRVVNRRLPYSIGEFHRPNSPETAAVEQMVGDLARFPDQRPLLVMPAGDKPVRRVLRALAAAAPAAMSRAVVVTGDSINLDVVYRDRDTSWNVQELPVSLVFFNHDNPAADTGPGTPPWDRASATHDLLLSAKIGEVLVTAAYGISGKGTLGLAESADELRIRLLTEEPPFFDRDTGNRLPTSGAYVVSLTPAPGDGGSLPMGDIKVWLGQARGPTAARQWSWILQKSVLVEYGQSHLGRASLR